MHASELELLARLIRRGRFLRLARYLSSCQMMFLTIYDFRLKICYENQMVEADWSNRGESPGDQAFAAVTSCASGGIVVAFGTPRRLPRNWKNETSSFWQVFIHASRVSRA